MGEAVTPRVAIIGAGPAGLTAAQHLLAHPSAPGVVLIDKGRHAGGRLCTRTLNLPDGTRARFDLGPQVLYARPFGNRPAEHRLVALANRQTDERLHEHRIVGRIGGPDEEAVVDVGGLSLIGGMREWAFRQVTAHRGRIELHDHTLAEKLERTGDGWRVHTRSLRDDLCTTVSANALIVTPPLPQALALLAGNGVALPDELRDALRAVHYTRCVALYGMFAGNGPLQPGGVWFRDGPLEWVTDNARKGVSEVGPAVTALSSNEWAKANWHEPDGRLIELLLPRLHPWVGDPLDPAQVFVHRWQWARPVNPVRLPCAVLRDAVTVLAGDGFAGGTPDPVDAAVVSGEAAARRAERLLTDLARRDARYTVARPARYTLEIVVTTPEEAVAARNAGADRLELSSGLALGGVTPSLGLLREVRKAVPEVPVYVMLRPRPGGFAYTPSEFAVMKDDARTLLDEGAAGIVFGNLTARGEIHSDQCRALVKLACGRAVFHRAFDFLADQLGAIDELIELGFERVLTSGAASTAEAGTNRLTLLVQHAGWQLAVMPGGRVRAETVADLVRATRCEQVHAGPRARVDDMILQARATLARGMGEATELDADAVYGLRQQLDALVGALS